MIETANLRIATYNIHSSIGTDGKYNPSRIKDVIEEIGAQIVGIQETDPRLLVLGKKMGYEIVAGPTLRRGEDDYGNALLTMLPVSRFRQIDLSISGYEPRSALDVSLKYKGMNLQIITTHLGLKITERAKQLAILLDQIGPLSDVPVILMGDFNEWQIFRGCLKHLRKLFTSKGRKRTFPAPFPVLKLDEIFVYPKAALKKAQVHFSEKSRIASDHLPVVAQLNWSV